MRFLRVVPLATLLAVTACRTKINEVEVPVPVPEILQARQLYLYFDAHVPWAGDSSGVSLLVVGVNHDTVDWRGVMEIEVRGAQRWREMAEDITPENIAPVIARRTAEIYQRELTSWYPDPKKYLEPDFIPGQDKRYVFAFAPVDMAHETGWRLVWVSWGFRTSPETFAKSGSPPPAAFQLVEARRE